MSAPTVRLRLRVAPGARRSAVVGRLGDRWKVSVAAAPERGKANDQVVALLADRLGLRRPDVRVVAGLGTRDKVVELTGITVVEAERRLAAGGKEAS
jgi:hypothetical protein